MSIKNMAGIVKILLLTRNKMINIFKKMKLAE